MNISIKNIALTIVAVVVLFFTITKGPGLVKDYFLKAPIKVVTQPLNLQKPSEIEKNSVPKNHKIIGVLKPVSSDSNGNRWEKKDTSIVVHIDEKCNTCSAEYQQVVVTKPYFGFSFHPKFYIGMANGDISLGYNQEILRARRVTLDGLISIPYAGLGVSLNVTDNFYVGGGAVVKYIEYSHLTDAMSYRQTNLTQVGPIVYLGFYF